MKKNLLIITQKVDAQDDLLGFFVDWINEFSKKFDKVFVITLWQGHYEAPANVFVYSLGKEKNYSRFLKFIRFYFLLFKLIPKSSGIFAHMSPVFAVASWPVAFIFRKRIILWYLHRSVTSRLKLAENLVYKIATAAKESLNLKSKKIIELGHGIKTERFKTERFWPAKNEKLRILSVGRISKIKNYGTLIRAAKILKDRELDFEIKIIGRPVMPDDFDYFKQLKNMTVDLGLKDIVEFAGFVPHSRISDYYKDSDIFINLAPTGGIDKAVLEATASGLLVLISNLAFKKYFGGQDLFFKQGNPDDLADKISNLISLPSGKIKEISDFLVQSVKRHHNLETLINSISSLF